MKKGLILSLLLSISLTSFSQKGLWGVNRSGGDNGYGSIYYYDTETETYVNQHAFDVPPMSNGIKYAWGSLIFASDGNFYGTTSFGGSNNFGVIFKYDPALDTLINMHSFNSDNGDSDSESLVEVDGKLYGVTYRGGDDWDSKGVLFEFNLSNGSYKILKEFITLQSPRDGLTVVGRKLYGFTSESGTDDAGVLFEYNIDGNSFSVKYNFNGTSTGDAPRGNLVLANDGYLYGTTLYGGANNKGVLYQYLPGSTSITIKKEFTSSEGGGIKYLTVDGNYIYGVASNAGGADDHGTIFRYLTTNGTFELLHQFEADTRFDTFHQGGGLVKAENGMFYGTTSTDGDNNKGYIYEWDPTNSTFTDKYHNTVADGYYPGYDILIEAAIPTVTSTKTPSINHTTTIFPNPSSSLITIQSELEWLSIEVYNSTGEKVMEVTERTKNTNLELEKSGVYILKIKDDNSVQTKKVIIE